MWLLHRFPHYKSFTITKVPGMAAELWKYFLPLSMFVCVVILANIVDLRVLNPNNK